MGKYYICGGKKLEGDLNVKGSKNAVLPILAATILNSSKSYIHNCPKILDTIIMIEILKSLGCKVELQEDTIIVDSSCCNLYEVPERYVKEMRSSIVFLGSLIGRFKNVIITYPGGCELGKRPIDLHFKALRKMGISITESDDLIVGKADNIMGTYINLDFPSVGATENIMLAAALAKGTTTIKNPAKEPEIVDLQNFLVSMGAKVYGAGTDIIYIEGVEKLHETEYTVIPDRIVTGTLLTAAAITKGEVYLNQVNTSHIQATISSLKECGCDIKAKQDIIYLKAPHILKPVNTIKTLPYPGFPTDMQPQFVALLSVSDGISSVTETVFESRYKYIDELMKMGANINIDDRKAMIKGVKELKGATVEAMDLRGGAALIIAGLAALGETVVLNSKHIQRGYENIENMLCNLGADIEFIE